MFGANIIADNTPQVAQIIQRAVEEIRQISSQVKVEYIDYDKSLIPTKETLESISNSVSVGRFKSVAELRKAMEADD